MNSVLRLRRGFSIFLLKTLGNISPESSTSFGIGKLANKFRYLCAKNIVSEIGATARIGKGSELYHGVVLKNKAMIGRNCEVRGGTTIEGGNSMGPECKFYTSNHKYNKQKLKCEGVTKKNQY